MPDATPENDESISNEEELWRRVPSDQVIFDSNLNSHRPSTQAFQNSGGTSSMSVNLASETTIEDTLKDYENYLLVSFETRLARELSQGVKRSPLPDNAAHTEVTGNKTKGVRKKFKIGCAWVVAPT